MDIVKKIVNGNEYMFINNFRGNRSGFVHETELFKNDRLIGKNKIQYYNRTWECYTYQSVMKSCIRFLLGEILEKFELAYKNEHGIKRWTKEKRRECYEEFEGNSPANYMELYELYSML